MTKTAFILALTTAALGLSGCAALRPPPSLDTYELSAPEMDTSRARSRAQILIADPSALKAFDGQNVVIRTGPGAIQFLKGAQWADRLPEIVQARLAETFQNSGRFGGVGKPGEGLAIDYQIIAEIRAFDIRVNGSSSARVELFVKLLNDRNGVVQASRSFTATSPVSGSGNDGYIAALDRAFGKAAAEIVDWTVSTI